MCGCESNTNINCVTEVRHSEDLTLGIGLGKGGELIWRSREKRTGGRAFTRLRMGARGDCDFFAATRPEGGEP